jgi:hypothetical protein
MLRNDEIVFESPKTGHLFLAQKSRTLQLLQTTPTALGSSYFALERFEHYGSGKPALKERSMKVVLDSSFQLMVVISGLYWPLVTRSISQILADPHRYAHREVGVVVMSFRAARF